MKIEKRGNVGVVVGVGVGVERGRCGGGGQIP